MSGNTDFFPVVRNRYFYGKLLTVRDFEVEQNYMRKKSQLLSRLSLGAGVVCGLGVSASDDSTLLIESGMALDYQGRMVVVEEPLLRKLQMIEGQETLQGQESAYLCLSYDETDVEPVNAVGADTGASRQCNMTSEGCRLFLTAQPPEFRGLLEAAGRDNVSVLYASKELTLVLCAPEAVCAGALGVRLAGDAVYFGKTVKKPFIGEALRKIEPKDIRRANRLMYFTAWTAETVCILVMLATWLIGG